MFVLLHRFIDKEIIFINKLWGIIMQTLLRGLVNNKQLLWILLQVLQQVLKVQENQQTSIIYHL
jgi:hypothetical protein